jgi:protocatechuate 3,4-dioxygenase beta subunit
MNSFSFYLAVGSATMALICVTPILPLEALPQGEVKGLIANNEAAPVKVSGRVVNSKGEPMASFVLRLTQPIDDARVGSGGGVGDAKPKSSQPVALQSRAGRTVATATSDANGNFTFPAVKPGSYRITGGNPTSTGVAMHALQVEAGKPVENVEVKLRAPVE